MSDSTIRRCAPAVFGDTAADVCSNRYGFISTAQILDPMREAGWFPVAVQQARGKVTERMLTNKHVIRFRRADSKVDKVGDTVLETILTNAHNRDSSYKLDAGLFRFVCLNGMVIGDSVFPQRKFRHTQNIAESIVEATEEIVATVPELEDAWKRYNKIELSIGERLLFGKRALKLLDKNNVDPEVVVTPRRAQDKRPTLWATFNVIQENLTKGGMIYKSPKGRQCRNKGITNVHQSLRFNKQLWELTESYANFKGIGI